MRMQWFGLQIQSYLIFKYNSFRIMSKSIRCESQEYQNGSCELLELSESQVSQGYLKKKKISRKNNRKRIVKTIHTCCIFYFDQQGQRQTIWHQNIKYSHSTNTQLLKNKAGKEALNHNAKVIDNARQKADFSQNQSKTNYKTNSAFSLPAQGIFYYPFQYLIPTSQT